MPPTHSVLARLRLLVAASAVLAASAGLAAAETSVSQAAPPTFATTAGDPPNTSARNASTKQPTDARYRRGLFVDDLMSAHQAGGIYRKKIGKKAQALWLTDYYASPQSARSAVAAYTARAAAQDKTPVLAVYAIPGRDCGLYSSGGLGSYQDYRAWTAAAARGMRGHQAIVVVEPDAVAFMGDRRCVDAGPRQKAIAYAVKRFAKAGAWVYLDSGHSGWRNPTDVARLLKRSGMKWARGFSTNVGNHRSNRHEHAYGKRVVRALAKLGLKNRKYVIETARNGADPAPRNGDVCNPWLARIGRAPTLLFRGAFDGYLWIKHPGESDGECNGGPSSGTWWPTGADSLLGPR